MKPTDFAKHLTDFLTTYLSGQKNVSKNTIFSYRDTFKLLLKYCRDIKDISPEKITMVTLSSELITDFLQWLQAERKCCASTRNQRLASIHSFFRYAQGEDPSGIYHFQKVIAIPAKKTEKKLVAHLTQEAIKLLLEQPDCHSARGRRDLTLMSLLYDTAARVQELIDIKVCDVILNTPALIVLHGKGKKTRRVPIMKNTVKLLQIYLSENGLDKQWKDQHPLFTNNQHIKLTKEGVSYIQTFPRDLKASFCGSSWPANI